MYQHILVPLDQSELAEQALPHALELARVMHSEVTLIAVVDVLEAAGAGVAGAARDWEAEIQSLDAYLQAVCRRLEDEGVPCRWEVLKGDIGEEILRFAEAQDCDLIVMSTHGRSGLARWVHGSVADRILTQTPVPLLLVRAEE